PRLHHTLSLHDALPISGAGGRQERTFSISSFVILDLAFAVEGRQGLGSTKSRPSSSSIVCGRVLGSRVFYLPLLAVLPGPVLTSDRKSTRLNSTHVSIS